MKVTRIAPAASLAMTALLVGCGSDDNGFGPCVHNYLEPIITLERVIGTPAGTELSQVTLSDFSLGGIPFSAQELCPDMPTGMSYPPIGGIYCENATPEDDVLICDLPCQFGNSDGDYEFTLTAEHYAPKTVEVQPEYAVFEGGCPSWNDEGSRYTFELDEQE
ncbi:hypothetical protein [Marinimicrobium alkaliphilum]|uniref:hypothetical protein n=1 Tax=Marinimicrobium alkaliphilum TaxID=2202654 RepID=UPI000DB94E7B|nr:hypothetical protein [Marinimicrobium alkaliphilum]